MKHADPPVQMPDPWTTGLIDTPTQEAIIREMGRLLRQIRVTNGFKMVELAALCNISQSVLCRVELGHRKPGLPLLLAICSKLGVRLSDLFRAAEEAAVPLPIAPRDSRLYKLM